MKRFHRLKKNKGFTLAEMMMSLLLLSIIIVLSAGIIIMSGNIFAKDVVLSDIQTEADNLCRTVADRIRCANSFEFGQNVNSTGDYSETLFVSGDGSKVSLGNNISSDSKVLFEHGGNDDRKVRLIIDAGSYSSRGIELTVNVYDSYNDMLANSPRYTITRSVFPLNMKFDSSKFQTGKLESGYGSAVYMRCTYID